MPGTSVVIPTVGRRPQLDQTLRAVLACDPPPGEVIVIDQSHRPSPASDGALDARVRLVADAGRGAGRARNAGARAATNELLLFADDDCVPRRDWIATALELHRLHPSALLTGDVLPGEGREGVPSTREGTTPVDHTGSVGWAVLYSGNMVVARKEFLEFGGFDERFPGAGGEDNDLCYRWLRAQRELRYEPTLVVVHLDWRGPDQLREVWAEYGRTQGMFYAKHLRAGDARMLRFLVADVVHWARARLAGAPRRSPDVPAIGPTVQSIVRNWRRFG